MASKLQELRKEAGFKSAKDFAAEMEIPASTYSRYEAQPDSIPLSAAWKIADFFKCPIDLVVGREVVTIADMRGDVQKFYDDLSPINKSMMDDYMEYLGQREERAKENKKREDRIKYLKLAMGYEEIYKESLDTNGMRDFNLDSPQGKRTRIEAFIKNSIMEKRLSEIDEILALKKQTALDGHLPVLQEDGSWDMVGPDDEHFDELLQRELIDSREDLIQKFAAYDDMSFVSKVMKAYDDLHPATERRVEYAVINLEDL